MDIINNFPQGYWETAGRHFINKHDALVHATQQKTPIYFKFFNEVWDKFDRSLIGKLSLQEVYKQRAQQLRDKYDYLILYFSGGADSYNVLRTFIDNDIKIDEVCVKWCNATLEANTLIYSVNDWDTSACNYLSEWDLAIKPVLEEIAATHPDIKIEIVDWFKNRASIGSEDAFRLVNHWHDVEVPSLAVWSPNEQLLIEQGKTVGSIYGIDKPMVYFDESATAYMFFTDSGTTMGTPNPCNIYGTEYFYWAPEFPLITFETAAATVLAMRADPVLYNLKFDDSSKTNRLSFVSKWQQQQKKLRHILYDNWTDRFQAYKPMTVDRSDKHQWIFNYNELENFRDSYVDMCNLHTTQVAKEFLLSHTGRLGTSMYKFLSTKKFPIF
jgi:hypothetical protein